MEIPNNEVPVTEEVKTADQIVPEVEPINLDEAEPAQELPPGKVEAPSVEVGMRKQNVVFDQSPLEEIPAGQWDPEADTIDLPTALDKHVSAAIEGAANVDLTDSAESRKWANAVNEGMRLNTFGEVFDETLSAPNAEFRQSYEFNGKRIGSSTPRFDDTDKRPMVGERGVLHVLSKLGLADVYQVELPNSGAWVTFKSPSDTEIVNFHRTLVADKIQLGRYSYGLMFSNVTAFSVERIFQFALEHVYNTTVSSSDLADKNLGDVLRVQDLPSFLLGFANTIYPKGFQYRRACINDPDKCNHVAEGRIHLDKLQVINHRPLTDWMKTHLAVRRPNSKSLADIIRYQSELIQTQPWRAEIEGAPGMFMTFKSPTINEYIDAGHVWIGSIVEMVDKVLGSNQNETERNNLITSHGQATTMRQYVHWVESIEVGDKVIDDRETIEKTLDRLSVDDTIRVSFIKKVVDYINSSTLAVVALPGYDCPKCKLSQDVDVPYKGFNNVVPVDVIQLFFGLITQRILRISER